MEKIYVLDTIHEFDFAEDLDRPLLEFISYLQSLNEEHEKEGWKNLKIASYQYYEDVWIRITGERLETDKEFERRKKKVEKELNKEQDKLKKQQQLYLKLKAKFEGNEESKS